MIQTGIHTRIDGKARISSAWRTYANSNFSLDAWETFLWVDEKIAGEYTTLDSADDVVKLHKQIAGEYLIKVGDIG